jgi:type IV pilus assembly protein PilB
MTGFDRSSLTHPDVEGAHAGSRAGTSGDSSAAANGPTNPVNDRVSDVLEKTALVSSDELTRVRERAGDQSLADALAEERRPPASEVARALADAYHLRFVDLSVEGIDASAADTIPQRVLERTTALPYRLDGERLYVAIADPTNVQAIDELRLATRYALEIGVAAREEIEVELARRARDSEAWDRTALVEEELSVEADEGTDQLEVDDGISDAPLVRLVNSIILQAAEDNASDVHFDPHDDVMVVRERVDGVLHEMQRVPKRIAVAVVTRLKVLAKLDIAERRKPQDGRISLSARSARRLLDIRVSVLPTVEGERVVMRLLDKSKRAPTLTDLGLSEAMQEEFEDIIARPTGALLVTGPTGSGKTTTLYAALAEVNRPEINIITVEDPVEYRLRGVNQVQIIPKAGLTFASALRSILRSDPDVIMVGEIRDAETAKISIEAALTGHFVLSTLHTNDAPGALTRLNEMGVPPFLTGSAVTAVLAQRLARKLCQHCSEMYVPTREELAAARFPLEEIEGEEIVLHRKVGCPRCSQTGYKGRVGIFQLMRMSEALEHLAAKYASRDELERAAKSGGMKTLWEDGLAKARAGVTSLEELERVLI